MSYPRNAASPPPIGIGPIYQISDGAKVTSGASVYVTPAGGSQAVGTGTLTHKGNGEWHYTPAQAETDYEMFSVLLTKTDCTGDSRTVVPSASDTAGQVVTDEASRTASKADVSVVDTIWAAFLTLWDSDSNGAIDAVDAAAAKTNHKLSTAGVEAVQEGLATQTSVDALNDLNVSDVAGAVWNAAYADYAVVGSFGRLLGTTWRTLFTGVTSLASWLGALAGKTADAATLAEINATTAGTTFDNALHSLESLTLGVGGAGTDLETVIEHLLDIKGTSFIKDEHSLVRIAVSAVGVPGAAPVVLTLTTPTGTPIGGARAWVSTDQAGKHIVAGYKTTDDFGKVTFQLMVGTYWLWRDHSRYDFPTNPVPLVVPSE